MTLLYDRLRFDAKVIPTLCMALDLRRQARTASYELPALHDVSALSFVSDRTQLTPNEERLQNIFELELSDVDEVESQYGEIAQ